MKDMNGDGLDDILAFGGFKTFSSITLIVCLDNTRDSNNYCECKNGLYEVG